MTKITYPKRKIGSQYKTVFWGTIEGNQKQTFSQILQPPLSSTVVFSLYFFNGSSKWLRLPALIHKSL